MIRPNASATWSQSVRCFASVAGVSLGVALFCTLLGFWPVLVFALLELAGLAVVLYVCALRACEREVISSNEERVTVEKGRRRRESREVFPRYWTHVVVQNRISAGGTHRLAIRCRSREVEVGGFLTEEEKQRLARRLGEMIGPVAR